MSSVFGLYVGNSTASIAVYKEDGKSDILANDAGDRNTLSTVYVTKKEEVVGLDTSGNLTKALSTILCSKTFFDVTLSNEDFDRWNKACNIKARKNGDKITFSIPVPDEDGAHIEYTPFKATTLIFQKLHSIGSSFCSDNSKLSCVLTVPLWWSREVRDSCTNAAIEAGWNVLQVINEPTAALLPYLSSSIDNSQSIAVVYRLGGYSCEATVFKIRSGFLTIVSSQRGDVGTRTIIDLVAQHLAEDFRRKTKLEPTESRKSMAKLRASAERLVKTLSSLPTASAHIESLCEGVDYSAALSRARLDALVSSALSPFTAPVNTALEKVSIKHDHVDMVVYAGGGLNINIVRSKIGSLFPPETTMCDSISPQEVIALGAAIQGGLLIGTCLEDSAEIKNHEMKLKVVATPVNVKVNGCEMNLEGPIPCSKYLEVPTPQANLIEVNITQGDTVSSLNVSCPNVDNSTTRINLHINRESNDIMGDSAVLNVSAVEAS